MFYALDNDNELVHIFQVNNNDLYFCPVCHHLLYIKGGINKKQHFAHQHHHSHRGVNETFIHQKGKELFLYWSTELGYKSYSEYWLREIN